VIKQHTITQTATFAKAGAAIDIPALKTTIKIQQ
jgi:hypothetical protein